MSTQEGLFYVLETVQKRERRKQGEQTPRVKREPKVRPLAAIPETGWRAPAEFPNLSAAKYIAIDTETYDPELLDCGPGWGRNSGRLVGISLAVDDVNKWYFPIAHELGGNLDKWKVLSYLKHTLGNPNQVKIGANLIYDLGWLKHEGVNVKGELVDIFFAEALLNDSAQRISLDYLANKYLDDSKEDDLLYKWCAESYGGKPERKSQGGNIYRAPVEIVGPYAEKDASLPLQVYFKQKELIKNEGLESLLRLENKLLPLLLEMRFKGVRIDLIKAEKAFEMLLEMENTDIKNACDLAGNDVNIYSAKELAIAFDSVGLSYPTTAKGNPSFTQEFLETTDHELSKAVVSARKNQKARSTFIENFILQKHVDGRLHGSFNPLKSEKGGTISGRFSASQPNLQQIPSRDKFLGPLIRGLYVPEEGHKEWIKLDYSQIEYRMLAHFAVGKSSDWVRDRYNTDTETDFHDATSELIKQNTGLEVSRYDTKRINFGLSYGMGQETLRNTLGLSKQKASELFSAYHKGVPFVKATFDKYAQLAERKGSVETILGRKARFNTYERKGMNKGSKPLSYDEARDKYGNNIQRFGTHKALNRLLQGSAADLMKAAMVQANESGIFDVLGVPLLTVHDELDFSNPGTPEAEEAIKELINIMQTAILLNVPVITDIERGPNWGEVK